MASRSTEIYDTSRALATRCSRAAAQAVGTVLATNTPGGTPCCLAPETAIALRALSLKHADCIVTRDVVGFARPSSALHACSHTEECHHHKGQHRAMCF